MNQLLKDVPSDLQKKLSLADFEVLELILGNTHMKVKL